MKMTEREVLQNLCNYDLRNPDCVNFNDWIEKEMEVKTVIKTEDGTIRCFCDNCFYGRAELANHILELNKNVENYE
jgi:hypothetical protein